MVGSSQSSTGFEGVYESGGGFGAELVQKGAKRLRQDGFRSPVEAALARARWTKSLEEGGKGHAPSATAGTSSGRSTSTSPPSSSAGHSEGEQQQQEPIRRWLGADLQHELASTPTPSLATTSVPRSEQGASQLAIAADGVLPAPPFNLAASGKSSLTPLHRATSSASTKRRAPFQSAAAPRAKKYSNSCD